MKRLLTVYNTKKRFFYYTNIHMQKLSVIFEIKKEEIYQRLFWLLKNTETGGERMKATTVSMLSDSYRVICWSHIYQISSLQWSSDRLLINKKIYFYKKTFQVKIIRKIETEKNVCTQKKESEKDFFFIFRCMSF